MLLEAPPLDALDAVDAEDEEGMKVDSSSHIGELSAAATRAVEAIAVGRAAAAAWRQLRSQSRSPGPDRAPETAAAAPAQGAVHDPEDDDHEMSDAEFAALWASFPEAVRAGTAAPADLKEVKRRIAAATAPRSKRMRQAASASAAASAAGTGPPVPGGARPPQ